MNIREFAEQIGVSRTAVSYAIHGNGRLSASTREMILRRADELDYQPNRVAYALATGKTNMVSLWMPAFNSDYYSQIVEHTQRILKEREIDTIISKAVANSCQSGWPVDGILAHAVPDMVPTLTEIKDRQRIPFVSFGAWHVEDGDYVYIDTYQGSQDAIRHLISTGRKRILHMLSSTASSRDDGRRRAYTDVMREAGLKTDSLIVQESDDRDAARSAIKGYIARHGCPDAVFCNSDNKAIGVYRAVLDLGFKVPDDMALIGCDGIRDIEFLETPISTVAHPTEEMCRLACRFLLNRIENPSVGPQQATLQAHLIVRESSAERR